MADQWYVARAGKKLGPYSSAQMNQMAVSGELLPGDMVLLEGAQQWGPASQIPEFFPATSTAPPPPALTPLASERPAPPPAPVSEPLPLARFAERPDADVPVPETAEWHYIVNGQQSGPVSWPQLRQLADSGQLGPSDKVWKNGMPSWTTARSIQSLAPPRSRPSTPPAIPARHDRQSQIDVPPRLPTNSMTSMVDRAKKVPVWGWLVAGVVGVPLVCCGLPLACIGVGNTAQRQNEDRLLEQRGIEVTAAMLINEYKDNEARANDKYEGKAVEVSGVVKRVTEHAVELEGGGEFELLTVDCRFGSGDRKTVASLSKGRFVRVKGVCKGKGFAAIEVSGCKLIGEPDRSSK